jgi:hypothetical protein
MTMLANITIPPEALRAARAASMNALGDGEDAVKAACLAMLANWPGMDFGTMIFVAADESYKPHIILPLPKEPSDDK